MASKRRQIRNLVADELKKINGGVSTFDPFYTYNSDLSDNVFKQLRFIDEVNDFPSIYVSVGREVRIYNSSHFTEAILPVSLKLYVYEENPQEKIENLIQDVEHVIYRISSNTSLEIQDINIDSISSDEGLIEPYGLGEMIFSVKYVLAD